MNKEVLSVGMKVRGIITRDGVLTEVQDQEPRFDAMEKVYFDLEIPSPLAEVSYQFVFTDKSGNSVTTRRYQLTRKCIPNVTGGAIIPDGQEQVTKDDARELKESADRLDEEIQLYEKVSQSLSLIQEAIDKK
jgi:1,4-alpha-glucan branching enzyme